MTLRELNNHFELREKLIKAQELLDALWSKAHPGAQTLTGMPHTNGVKDRVGDLAVEIAEMEERITDLQQQVAREEIPVLEFISGIEDDQTRLIFRLRFIRCLTWTEVADVIGGRNAGTTVKNICYRYLEICDAM